MQENWGARVRLLAGGALVAAAGLVSGCMNSPTYGTGKTANSQLMSDLGGIMSFSDKKKAPIDYAPRPELVKPAKGGEALPAPQEPITTASSSQWPESPEQRLARIRAEATDNQENTNYTSPVVADVAVDSDASTSTSRFKKTGQAWRSFESDNQTPIDEAARKAEIQKRIKETQQGDAANRKFLSEPPVEYRQAAADAPVGEVGEDEAAKERRLKKEARKRSGDGYSWEDLNPF